MSRRHLVVGGLASAGALALGCRSTQAEGGSGPEGAACTDSPTPSQILGPFPPQEFEPSFPGPVFPVAERDMDLTQVQGKTERAAGQQVLVHGKVLKACAPAVGATVMIWQADKNGRYNHQNQGVSASDLDPNFGFWGSTKVGADGTFTLKSIVPGAYAIGANQGKGMRPPHFHWKIVYPGCADLVTQTYFDGEELEGISEIRRLNDMDAILRFKMGFERLVTGNLAEARKIADEQLVVRFHAGDASPEGELTFHLA
jgi:protocatechuate 3,4-dioxygenase, beta subunit